MANRYEHPKGPRFKTWRAYLLSMPGTLEKHPFDPGLPVYFVGGKMFCTYAAVKDGERMNLKCWPDWSLDLRVQYPAIVPGYHMNKKHWNTVWLEKGAPRSLVVKLVDHSYDLVSGRFKEMAKADPKVKPREK